MSESGPPVEVARHGRLSETSALQDSLSLRVKPPVEPSLCS